MTKERGCPCFRSDPLLGQALCKGGLRGTLPYTGKAPGKRAKLDEKTRRHLETDVEERPFAKLSERREYHPKQLENFEKRHRYTHLFQRTRMLGMFLKSGECTNLGEAAGALGYSWRHSARGGLRATGMAVWNSS
jgi:hypothetical protein